MKLAVYLDMHGRKGGYELAPGTGLSLPEDARTETLLKLLCFAYAFGFDIIRVCINSPWNED